MLEKIELNPKKIGLNSINLVKSIVLFICQTLKPGAISFVIYGARMKIIKDKHASKTKKTFKVFDVNSQAASGSFEKYSENKGKKAATIPPKMNIWYTKSGILKAAKYTSSSGPAPKLLAKSQSLINPKNLLAKWEKAKMTAAKPTLLV
jgi:hypothetical protein